MQKKKIYDVIVVGAGHAGVEAALAAARMGLNTVIFSMELESIAMMPCNPSIGGTGKGHLVFEIDALGGEMGKNIDKAMIQSKMLNHSKGAAVQSLRAQADKTRYHLEMKKTLEKEKNLDIKQGEIIDFLTEKGSVIGVRTLLNTDYYAKAIIVCTGTFLGGKIFVGEASYESGPNGLAPSKKLSYGIKNLGIEMRRFKTGTPARFIGRTLNYEKMQEQKGDKEPNYFSFTNEDKEPIKNQVSCWLTYTNEKTHKIINENIEKSALYSGNIVGVGPRYCPSIEDKVSRFKDRKRHQLFVEPEGIDTDEMYIQGMSTSLPEDIQEKFYHTISGLEEGKITRPAYAIEYDSINSLELLPTLEHKTMKNLFFAGQINGTSGYEEAAAQGLMAGINAALKIKKEEPLILGRDEAYIGVLIDDLVTKGTNEPYRIMTSRAEYRLLLRQGNADRRLTEKGYRVGLIDEGRYKTLLAKEEKIEEEIKRLKKTYGNKQAVNEVLKRKGEQLLENNNMTLSELLKRPGIGYDDLAEVDDDREVLPNSIKREAEVTIKYEGYISKQLSQIKKMQSLEKAKIPPDINYFDIRGIRNEAREKLDKIQPITLGQASRISGVSLADINVLLVYIEKERREKR